MPILLPVTRWDFDGLVGAARADERVLGLVLTGSRGRGHFARPDSDWDVRMVVSDGAVADATDSYCDPRGGPVEVVVHAISDFERVGLVGADDEWDRYSYVRARVVVDKTDGRLAQIVAAKSALAPKEARGLGARSLDAYINSYYRSAKNVASDLIIEGQLDAAESLSPFLTALFAIHERVRPFNKFLRWELDEQPLGDPGWAAAVLLPRLQTIAASGDIAEQQRLFRDTERLARDRGFGTVVDGWEPDVAWLRGEATATAPR